MKRKYEHCLTLRLDESLDDLLTEAAYDRRTSKASWIRMAIRQSLVRTKTFKTGGDYDTL
jgi:hypothetical protein